MLLKLRMAVTNVLGQGQVRLVNNVDSLHHFCLSVTIILFWHAAKYNVYFLTLIAYEQSQEGNIVLWAFKTDPEL